MRTTRPLFLTLLVAFYLVAPPETLRRAGGASPEPRDRYGVNVYFQDDRNIRRQLELVGSAGIRWARIGFDREQIHRAPGKFDWGVMDVVVEQAARRDAHILGILGESPAWDTNRPGDEHYYTYPPKRYDQWADYVFQTVRRYKKRVHHWEVWNEEDAPRPKGDWDGSPTEYARLLAIAFQQIKRADPSATVVLGGFVGGSFSDTIDESVPFLKAILTDPAHPAAQFFEIMNIHTYGTRQQAESQVRLWLEVMKQLGLGGRPLWITEAGWPADPKLQREADPAFCCGEPAKAKYLVAVLPELAALGAEKVFWWPLWIPNSKEFEPFRTYGLLDFGLNSTPAFVALKGLLAKPAK